MKYKRSLPPPLPISPPPKLHPPLNRRRIPNFCPSANVKRLISHSETLHSDAMNEDQSIDYPESNREKNHSLTCHVVASTDGGKIKLPLSKITSKLKDFGNDLVIDDSDGGYVTPPEIPFSTKNDNIYEIINVNNGNVNNDLENDANDKTPINESPPFDFDDITQDDEYHVVDNDAYDEVEYDHGGDWDANKNINSNNETTIPNTNSIHKDTNENETISLNSAENAVQSSPTLSHKSFDSDTKSTESKSIEIKEEDSSNPSAVENASNDIVTNEQESNAALPNNTETTKIIKNTKIRPLSSVSISSTSSSSSSASDEHSSNQNAISYLASVESLADHSESELATVIPNLTVTERACLEIIDSERSYVCDLGQVIRG